MHMKYFQALGRIRDHYDEILERWIDDPEYGHMLLKTWNIDPVEKAELIEEREAIRYLVACQNMMAFDENAKKPKIEVVNRCFERHLAFLERVHGIHAYNVNKHRLKLARKQYKACRHYLFKFTLPAWVRNLPEEILTFENKYPDSNF